MSGCGSSPASTRPPAAARRRSDAASYALASAVDAASDHCAIYADLTLT